MSKGIEELSHRECDAGRGLMFFDTADRGRDHAQRCGVFGVEEWHPSRLLINFRSRFPFLRDAHYRDGAVQAREEALHHHSTTFIERECETKASLRKKRAGD